MQRCPKCGYRDGTDWPRILCSVAFIFLYLVFMLGGDYLSKRWNLLGTMALLVFTLGTFLQIRRDRRNQRQYLEMHPSITQRLKRHLNTTAPQK